MSSTSCVVKEQEQAAGAGAVAAAVDNEEAAMWHVECVGLCG